MATRWPNDEYVFYPHQYCFINYRIFIIVTLSVRNARIEFRG